MRSSSTSRMLGESGVPVKKSAGVELRRCRSPGRAFRRPEEEDPPGPAPPPPTPLAPGEAPGVARCPAGDPDPCPAAGAAPGVSAVAGGGGLRRAGSGICTCPDDTSEASALPERSKGRVAGAEELLRWSAALAERSRVGIQWGLTPADEAGGDDS